MRILYILNSGSPGGMEQHVLDLVLGMTQLGHEVYVWCPEGVVSDWYKDAGAKITNVVIKKDLDFDYISALKVFLELNKIAIVHAHELKASANALIAGYLAHTPVRISHLHTPMTKWPVKGFKKLFTVFQAFFYALEVNTLATTEIALTHVAKKTKLKEGMRPSKLTVIPNGIDTVRFELSLAEKIAFKEKIRNRYLIPTNAFVFGNISRATEEKGHDILIKAFAEFLTLTSPNNSNYYLMICGGGRLEGSLRELVKTLKIVDRVIITGIFPAGDLVSYYTAMDAFVFPSRAEGFGFVLVEAMYMRLPVLCSDIPVLKEVGNETVSYFKDGDVMDLAQKMEALNYRLASGDEALLTMTLLAKNRVATLFSMRSFVTNYLKLYEKLMSEALPRV